MIERIIDAEYTAEKQEGTVPPCENSVVTVTGTYTYEFTLEDGDSLSDIDTTDLTEGSIAIDGDTTYEWDGTQWVSSGGGGGDPTFRKVSITNNRQGTNAQKRINLKTCFAVNGKIGDFNQLFSTGTKDYYVPITYANNTGTSGAVGYLLILTQAGSPGLTIESGPATVMGSFSDSSFNYNVVKTDVSNAEEISITVGSAS